MLKVGKSSEALSQHEQDQSDIKNTIKDRSHKRGSLRFGGIALALLPLSACGGGGSSSPTGSTTPPPPPTPDFTEDPTNVFIARDDNDRTLDQATATADLTVTGKAGNDSITTGSGADTILGGAGNDTITSGDGADMIRGGEGNDTITAGDGDDVIVVVGTTTAGQYTDAAITNPASSGVDLSSLITLADLNDRTISEVVSGETIDGGAGNNTLYIYGTVDLTGVTLTNVTRLIVNSDVTLTAAQIIQFTSIDGDGNSVINIVVPEGSGEVILDLSAIDVSDIGAINIQGNITIRINTLEDVAGIAQITVNDSGSLKLVVSGSDTPTTIRLQDIAESFAQVDTIDLGDQVTLNVETAEAIISVDLTSITGSGEVNPLGSIEASDMLNTLDLGDQLNIIPAALSTLENAPLIITVDDLLARATGIEGDVLTIQNLILTGEGSLVENGDNSWTYTPVANSYGTVSLSYDVSDGTQTAAASTDLTIDEITYTIPYGDFEGTVLHFNDPLLPFQSNILGFMNRNTGGYVDGVMSVPHINIIPVWQEYSGLGVRIGSPESIDTLHPDLAGTYLQELYSSYDPNIVYSDTNYHGTATAGIISAVADNGIGLVGIAYGATITSLPDYEHDDLFDVITNSTGTAAYSFFHEGYITTANIYALAANTGREELGTIHVISVGNGAANDHSTEASAFNNLFELMPVGLIDSGGSTGFTDFGSGVHISAPVSTLEQGSRAITLDRVGDLGLVSIAGNVPEHRSFDPVDFFPHFEDLGFKLSDLGLDTGDFTTLGGSSGSTPVVAGAVALVLEASGNNIFDSTGLGWRDVQEILALSARHIGSDIGAEQLFSDEHHGWSVNGADNFNGGGMHFSPDYGFGMLDVHAAVRLAETWTLQHTSTNLIIEDITVSTADVITYGTAVELSVDMTGNPDLELDVVTLDLAFTHDNWSELVITLISPDGTESIVFDTPGLTAGNTNSNEMNGELIWTVLSRQFWGENSQGVWTIRIEDVVDNGNSGSVGSITVNFQGDLATDDDTYFFTDD
ncbi:MAG: hypothetical protein COB54_09220, partial [Alphaproteobacteria bacterium]